MSKCSWTNITDSFQPIRSPCWNRAIIDLTLLLCWSSSCQPVTVRDDEPLYDPSPKSYDYTETDLTEVEPLRQDRQVNLYKATRRSERVPSPTYQYTVEDTVQEADYRYPEQQHPEAATESYPYRSPDYNQQFTRRLGTDTKKPTVEQYLKEVTPTTKTTYNRRAGNYLRSNGQAHVRGNKQQTEETERGILKQSPYQYVLQSELQQKAQLQPQIQYEVAEQNPVQSQPIPDQQPHAVSITTYQNALLAHQKVLLETDGRDDSSSSSIHVTHTVPKKPVRKIVKPKQSAVDEDVDYYTQLQQYQQHLQHQQQQVYEHQPVQVMYQEKIQYPKENGQYQPATEETLGAQSEKPVQYQQPRQYQQQVLQYQPTTSTRKAIKSRRPTKYHSEVQTAPEPPTYQPLDPSYEYQTPTKTAEPAVIRFHQPTPLRQGPKYLPEPTTLPHQQPSTLAEADLKYQPVGVPAQPQGVPVQPQSVPVQPAGISQQPQPLISYEAAIAKLQSEQLSRTRQQNVQQQSRYQEQDLGDQPVKFEYVVANQQVSNQEEVEADYIRPEIQSTRYHQGRRAAYRQLPQNSGVRYYRNLGRPMAYLNYE